MHGGFGRDSTFNNMAAMGPDFKSGFTDKTPVSNADIAPTIAHILEIDMPSKGKLKGRAILESLRGSDDKTDFTAKHVASTVGNGRRTVLQFQESGGELYFDRACFVTPEQAKVDGQCP